MDKKKRGFSVQTGLSAGEWRGYWTWDGTKWFWTWVWYEPSGSWITS